MSLTLFLRLRVQLRERAKLVLVVVLVVGAKTLYYVQAVVIIVCSSVRCVLTNLNDQRLRELSFLHIFSTFLNILAFLSKAVFFCITSTLSGIPRFSIHSSNPLVTLPKAPSYHYGNDLYHFEFPQSSDLSF